MKMTCVSQDHRDFLIRCTAFLAGILLLTGCNILIPQGEGAGGTALPAGPQVQPARMVLPDPARHNSVVISGQIAPVEPGLPFSIGTSVEGRPLLTYRFGVGSVFVALIGGIHGGYEANTVTLAGRFMELLAESPEIIPSDVSVFIIPAMNPDGLRKPGPKGRVNASQVDLNRNWGCNWVEDAAAYRGVPFTTGSSAFSEPETRAARDFLLHNDFKIAVFYHSRGAVIFHGECGGTGQSLEVAESVSRATGYRVVDSAEYPTTRALPGSITGEAADYLDSQGVAAIDVELSGRDDAGIDWQANYQGLLAIMDYAVRVYATPELSDG
ncbi:MAG: M14 family metallopeptidase [Anaerolineae bacterium]